MNEIASYLLKSTIWLVDLGLSGPHTTHYDVGVRWLNEVGIPDLDFPFNTKLP